MNRFTCQKNYNKNYKKMKKNMKMNGFKKNYKNNYKKIKKNMKMNSFTCQCLFLPLFLLTLNAANYLRCFSFMNILLDKRDMIWYY